MDARMQDKRTIDEINAEIADLTISLGTGMVDGVVVQLNNDQNKYKIEVIGQLREVALLKRNAPGALAHLQYLKNEGRGGRSRSLN